jgi:5-methylthioadenosine/S-adenosylhomocysteine deaminase
MLVLRNSRHLDPTGWHSVDLLLDAGRIVALGEDAAAGIGSDVQSVDASGLMVLPGLVNAHLHSNECFERGLYGALPLERWLARAYPPLGAPAVPPRWHRLRTLLCAIDALRSGCVAVQDDFLNPGNEPEALDAVMQAWADSGLRASVATTLGDRPYLDGLPFARELCEPGLAARLDARAATPLASQAAFFESSWLQWHGQAEGRLQIMLGPRGPQRCSDALLQQVAALAERHGSRVHMHVLETQTQAVTAAAQGGCFVRRLQRLGLLDRRLTINHAVWVDAAQIDALAHAGAQVTHNPLSNLKLGSGTAPLRALLDAGVTVALGSDGPATGDTADMVEVLRCAALLHRAPATPPSQWLGAAEAWSCATTGGAASMALAAGSGTLAVGAPADLMLLDLRHRAFIPLHDPVAQLVYAGTSEAVHSVIVGGRLLMHGRRILAFDEDAVLDEAREAGERFCAEHLPGKRASGEALDPLLEAVHRRVWSSSAPAGLH